MAAPARITLLADIRAARAEWERVIARVPLDRADEPGVAGAWSIKDIVAHVAWSDQEIAPAFESHTMAGSALWQLPLPQRNEAMVAESRGRSAPDVLRDAQAHFERLLAAIEALPEELLSDASAFDGMPPEWAPWQLIPGTTYGHYPQHIPGIQAWLERVTAR